MRGLVNKKRTPMEQTLWLNSGGVLTELKKQQKRVTELTSGGALAKLATGSSSWAFGVKTEQVNALGIIDVKSLLERTTKPAAALSSVMDVAKSSKSMRGVIDVPKADAVGRIMETTERQTAFERLGAALRKPGAFERLGGESLRSSKHDSLMESLSKSTAYDRMMESLSKSTAYDRMMESLSKSTAYDRMMESLSKSTAYDRMMAGLADSSLMGATSSIAVDGWRDRLASVALTSLYGPSDDEEAAVAAVASVVSSPFTKGADLSIVHEIEAIVSDPERVGRILGTEKFSWESETDVGTLSQVTEQIKLEGGADWWATFVAGVADMWNCRTPLGSGLGLRRSPEQIATLALILCALMACVFVPQSDEMADVASEAARPISQTANEVTGKAVVGTAVAFHEAGEVVGSFASKSWTSRVLPAGEYLWEEWGKDIVKGVIIELLVAGIFTVGAAAAYGVRKRRKNVKRSDMERWSGR
jgi:hypothetical protein